MTKVVLSMLWGYMGLFRVGVVILSFILTVPVQAQPIPDNSERELERIQEREIERQRAREERLRESQVTPPTGNIITPPEVEVAEDTQCLPIQSVVLEGLEKFSRDEFATEIDQITGECTSLGQINEVLRAITNRYISAGYVTSRAVVGPQDLTDGILEIVIVEGQISDIEGQEKGYGKSTLGAAFPGLKSGLLNLRDLEQGVDQLSRLPSGEPNIDIKPGDLPGTSVVVVSRKPIANKVRAGLSFNNDGQQSTGRIQSSVNIDIDNIFGVADYWSAYFSRSITDLSGVSSQGYGLFASLPYGYWTASVSVGRFEYESVLTGNGLSFENSGTTWNGSASLDRLVFRDSKTKLSVGGTLSLLDTENLIQGIVLATNSYRQVNGSANIRLQRRTKNGLLTASLGFSQGLNILGANSVDTGPDGPSILAKKADLTMSYQTKAEIFGIPVDYSSLVRVQSALDPVFSGQRLSLGGSSTVRGFRDDGISGRHGIFTRQQIGFPLKKIFARSGGAASLISGYIGYDAGAIICCSDNPFERGALHAATVGLRLGNRYIQSDLSLSRPISSPTFVEKENVVFAASLRLAF